MCAIYAAKSSGVRRKAMHVKTARQIGLPLRAKHTLYNPLKLRIVIVMN